MWYPSVCAYTLICKLLVTSWTLKKSTWPIRIIPNYITVLVMWLTIGQIEFPKILNVTSDFANYSMYVCLSVCIWFFSLYQYLQCLVIAPLTSQVDCCLQWVGIVWDHITPWVTNALGTGVQAVTWLQSVCVCVQSSLCQVPYLVCVEFIKIYQVRTHACTCTTSQLT